MYNDLLVNKITAELNGNTGSREENDCLYVKVLAGDKTAKRRMVTLNLPFVMNKVESYISCCPDVEYLRDDLVSEGFLALITAVESLSGGAIKEDANPNPTGYISYTIQRHLGALIDGERANGASSRTVRRRKKSGEAMPQQVPMPEQVPSTHDIWIDPTSMPVLRDLLYSSCETEIDRQIIDLRERGHKDAEVAKIIDTPLTTTYMLRRAIYARFLEKSGLSGEA